MIGGGRIRRGRDRLQIVVTHRQACPSWPRHWPSDPRRHDRQCLFLPSRNRLIIRESVSSQAIRPTSGLHEATVRFRKASGHSEAVRACCQENDWGPPMAFRRKGSMPPQEQVPAQGSWKPPTESMQPAAIDAEARAASSSEGKVVMASNLFVAAGAAMIVGTFMPWVKLTAPFIGTLTFSGLDKVSALGVSVVGIGACLGLIGLLIRNRRRGHVRWRRERRSSRRRPEPSPCMCGSASPKGSLSCTAWPRALEASTSVIWSRCPRDWASSFSLLRQLLGWEQTCTSVCGGGSEKGADSEVGRMF